jgi:hypothetical protein
MVIKVYNRLLNNIQEEDQNQLFKNELQAYVLQHTFYSVEEPRLLILTELAVYQHIQTTEHHYSEIDYKKTTNLALHLFPDILDQFIKGRYIVTVSSVISFRPSKLQRFKLQFCRVTSSATQQGFSTSTEHLCNITQRSI